MKKIALFCVTALCSGASLATSNFATSTGIVVIPDVNVNGTAVYDSVTLKLDFGNNTFSVLNAQSKNTTISDTPIDTLTTEGYDIGFLGCATTGTNEITCYMRVINNQIDRTLRAYGSYSCCGTSSVFFDDLNNSYLPSSITFTNATDASYVDVTLIQGVPANLSMTFKGIDIRAKSISSFKPSFYDNKNKASFQGDFKNVKF